jgi:branched-chain amino acid transport system substrate-binding protein
MRQLRTWLGGCSVALGVLAALVAGASGQDGYKIGYLHSFTGYLGGTGGPSRDGFMAAIDQINKKGGVNGRRVTVIQENDESDPSKGVPAAIRLMNAEKVLAIVGPGRSDVTEALGPIAEKQQVVDMTCSFIMPTKGTYTFDTVPKPTEEARAAIGFIKARGAKSLAIINAIDLYDKTTAKEFADEAGRQGVKVVGVESFNAAVDKNFIPQLTKLRAGNPDWLAVVAAGAPTPLILNQKAEMGFNVPVIGNLAFTVVGQPSLLKIAGQNAQGVHVATVPVAVWESLPKDDPRLPKITEFREAYKALHKEYPVMANWWIAQNWDIAHLLAEALRRAGANPTGTTVKTAMESIKDFHGVTGSFTFSPTEHAGASGVVIARIEGERLVLAK